MILAIIRIAEEPYHIYVKHVQGLSVHTSNRHARIYMFTLRQDSGLTINSAFLPSSSESLKEPYPEFRSFDVSNISRVSTKVLSKLLSL